MGEPPAADGSNRCAHGARKRSPPMPGDDPLARRRRRQGFVTVEAGEGAGPAGRRMRSRPWRAVVCITLTAHSTGRVHRLKDERSPLIFNHHRVGRRQKIGSLRSPASPVTARSLTPCGYGAASPGRPRLWCRAALRDVVGGVGISTISLSCLFVPCGCFRFWVRERPGRCALPRPILRIKRSIASPAFRKACG